MAHDENKAVARRLIEEVWNKGNLDLVEQLVAADYGRDDPANPGVLGPAGYRAFVAMYRRALPDLHLSIEHQLADGDLVATRWTLAGTHRDALFGASPTGQRVTITGVTISRIENGRMVQSWVSKDSLGLFEQLGTVTRVK